MSLNIIVVAYNQAISCSPVIKAVKNSQVSQKLIIVDNSTEEKIILENKKYASSNEIEYVCMEGNVGLSVAYNIGINRLKKINEFNWFVFFDQDTVVNETYFDAVLKSINENSEIMIHVPIVNTDKGIFSPLFPNKNDQYTKIKAGLYENLICINSGSVIHKNVFNRIGLYDEDLFLDMVDYNFFSKYNTQYSTPKYKVFNYQIFQNFSGENKGTFKSDLARFKIYVNDYCLYCFKNKICIKEKYWTLIKRSVKLSYLHCNIKFILYLIKNLY